jgi:hypothetical protein
MKSCFQDPGYTGVRERSAALVEDATRHPRLADSLNQDPSPRNVNMMNEGYLHVRHTFFIFSTCACRNKVVRYPGIGSRATISASPTKALHSMGMSLTRVAVNGQKRAHLHPRTK